MGAYLDITSSIAVASSLVHMDSSSLASEVFATFTHSVYFLVSLNFIFCFSIQELRFLLELHPNEHLVFAELIDFRLEFELFTSSFIVEPFAVAFAAFVASVTFITFAYIGFVMAFASFVGHMVADNLRNYC